MKSLLVSDIFPPRTGGSGRWFWEITVDSRAGRTRSRRRGTLRQELFDRTHDLEVTRLPLAMRAWGIVSWVGLRGYVRAVGRLSRLLAAEQIEMVHAARCLPEGVMALALRLGWGVPYTCYVHGEDIGTARSSREHCWLAGRVLRNATYLIANSRNTEPMLVQEWGLPPGRSALLHPGVDTRGSCRRRGTRRHGRAGLERPAGGPDGRPAPAPEGP